METSNLDKWLQSRAAVGWVPLKDAVPETWQSIGFKCGLEVHQQLDTKRKLFCRCPAGIYHDFNEFDAEVVRHMRPTLSELGEYDGTALMEFKTRKKIVYRIKNDSACTYEVDDTPPFQMNREALQKAMRIALLLKLNIVGEMHITRKQYLDGSIPTGFQRTGILGIEGSFPISNKTIRVIQFSVEEDSCREVSDHRHERIYYADRLGMPLIETVTYPDMLTPWEASEAARNIRFIARGSGAARKGIGAAREDVNVSVTGGTRIEIKGVARIRWIPLLTHNEAFRQKALLRIKDLLHSKIADQPAWKIHHTELNPDEWKHVPTMKNAAKQGWKLYAVNLPGFADILGHFTQPGKCFADEISERLKVIACLEQPNLFHSEPSFFEPGIEYPSAGAWLRVKRQLKAHETDAQLIFWAPDEDLKTALETIEERCRMAFEGVPNETRKSLPGGITIFERVLPGADRMYPDTDSAPIAILDELIETVRQELPLSLEERFRLLSEWQIPPDAYTYILRNDLIAFLKEHSDQARQLAVLFAHHLKSLQGAKELPFGTDRVADLLRYLDKNQLSRDLLKPMLSVLFKHPNMQFASILHSVGYKEAGIDEVMESIPLLHDMWIKVKRKGKLRQDARLNWIMGRLRKPALGNISLTELRKAVEKELTKLEIERS